MLPPSILPAPLAMRAVGGHRGKSEARRVNAGARPAAGAAFVERAQSPQHLRARPRGETSGHGDNTTAAFRYAPSLGSDVLGLSSRESGGGPHQGARSAWMPPLPRALWPLLGGLPGLLNNLRQAQRGLAWWRYFDAREALLARQLHAMRAELTGEARPANASRLAQARAAQREAMGLGLALREASFNLGFNLVESLSYLTGWLPLLARRLVGRGGPWQRQLPATSLFWSLVASGGLHVVQRACALSTARAARRAVEENAALPAGLARAVTTSCAAEAGYHALQLGCWLGFCLGLVAAASSPPAASSALWGGSLAVASMVVARVQRLACGRRYDVPDHIIWRAEADAGEGPPLHRRRAFAEPHGQADAWASLVLQRAAVAALQRDVLATFVGGWRGRAVALALRAAHVPLAAPLVAAMVGRWSRGTPRALATTLLEGHLPLWRAQLATVEAELAEASAHQRAGLRHERERLGHLLVGAGRWLDEGRHGPDEVWAVLGETWHLPPCPPLWRAAADGAPWAQLGALLVEVQLHVDDEIRGLLWGCKVGCLQRQRELA